MVKVIRTALNRKLLRELWQMRGQALAIAAVVMAGVAMLVMYLSNFASLQDTLARYYTSQRLADVFAVATRAPLSLVPRVAALPGSRLDGRAFIGRRRCQRRGVGNVLQRCLHADRAAVVHRHTRCQHHGNRRDAKGHRHRATLV